MYEMLRASGRLGALDGRDNECDPARRPARYDIGTREDAPYIVAELLEGEELRDQLTEGALTMCKAIEYAQQITSGLAGAHGGGIVRRYLKPERWPALPNHGRDRKSSCAVDQRRAELDG